MIDFGDKLFAELPAPTFARRAQASVRCKVAAWQVRPCDMAGAMVGGYLGGHGARRLPAVVFRVLIIVVGVLALVSLAVKH